MKELLLNPGEWSLRDTINLYILIMVFSGVCGFLYEELFYLIDLGHLVKRGSSYGPWIPIYMFGGLLITLTAFKFRDNALLVFLLGVVGSGVLEYVTGYVLWEFFHTRLWDYNTEIWNWGNINGYICLRSVLLFGAAGVMLICKVVPFLIRFVESRRGTALSVACSGLFMLWLIDIIVYQLRHW